MLSAARGNGYHPLPAQRPGPKSADLYTWPRIPWLTPALFFHCLFHLTGGESCLSGVPGCIWWSLLGLETASNTVLPKGFCIVSDPSWSRPQRAPQVSCKKIYSASVPGAERRGHSYTGPSLVSSAPHTVEPSGTHLASPHLLFSSINSKHALFRVHPKSYVMVKEDYEHGKALPAAMD